VPKLPKFNKWSLTAGLVVAVIVLWMAAMNGIFSLLPVLGLTLLVFLTMFLVARKLGNVSLAATSGSFLAYMLMLSFIFLVVSTTGAIRF